jgi:hypothetical protein
MTTQQPKPMPQPTPQPTLGPPQVDPDSNIIDTQAYVPVQVFPLPIAHSVARRSGVASLACLAILFAGVPSIASPGCSDVTIQSKAYELCLTTTERGEPRVDLRKIVIAQNGAAWTETVVSVVRLRDNEGRRTIATTTMVGQHTRTVPNNDLRSTFYSSPAAVQAIAKVSGLVNGIVTDPVSLSHLGFSQ